MPTPPRTGGGYLTPPAPAHQASVVLVAYVQSLHAQGHQFSVSFLDNYSVLFQSTWGPPVRVMYRIQPFGAQQTRIVLFFPNGAEHLDLQFLARNGGRFALLAPMARLDEQFVTHQQLH